MVTASKNSVSNLSGISVSEIDPSGAGTPACRVGTHADTCARIGIIFRTCNQTRSNGVVLDIRANWLKFPFIPHEVIVRLRLPERLAGTPENLVSLPRRETLQRLKQPRRSNQRKQKRVNMIRHDNERLKLVMLQSHASEQRIHNEFRNPLLLQKQRTGSRPIQIPVNPDERLARGGLPGRRVDTGRNAAVQTPGYKKPLAFGMDMGQPAGVHLDKVHTRLEKSRVHMSVDTAGMSACATNEN